MRATFTLLGRHASGANKGFAAFQIVNFSAKDTEMIMASIACLDLGALLALASFAQGTKAGATTLATKVQFAQLASVDDHVKLFVALFAHFVCTLTAC